MESAGRLLEKATTEIYSVQIKKLLVCRVESVASVVDEQDLGQDVGRGILDYVKVRNYLLIGTLGQFEVNLFSKTLLYRQICHTGLCLFQSLKLK